VSLSARLKYSGLVENHVQVCRTSGTRQILLYGPNKYKKYSFVALHFTMVLFPKYSEQCASLGGNKTEADDAGFAYLACLANDSAAFDRYSAMTRSMASNSSESQ